MVWKNQRMPGRPAARGLQTPHIRTRDFMGKLPHWMGSQIPSRLCFLRDKQRGMREGDGKSTSGLESRGGEAGAEGSGNQWGWASVGEEEALSLPVPPSMSWFGLLLLGTPHPPRPGCETWEPFLPSQHLRF